MKRFYFIPLFLAFGVIHFGCSEDGPYAPEVTQEDQVVAPLAKKEHTDFEGTSVTFAVLDPGKVVATPEGREHTRGLIVQTNEVMSDSRVTGVVTWVVNMDVYENGEDTRWGVGELVIEGVGSWHMPYKGWCRENPDDGKYYVRYEVDGHGKGAFKGLKAHWTYSKEAVPGAPFAVDGYIIERP